MKNSFSRQVTVFHGRKLPEEGFLAGYGQLIAIIETQFKIEIPLPDKLAMVMIWEYFTEVALPLV